MTSSKLIEMIEQLADGHPLSDIHIRVDEPIAIRVNGEIVRPSEQRVTNEESQDFLQECLSEEQLEHLEEFRDADLAIKVGECRFRANFFCSSTGLTVALRKIESEIPTMDQLDLPHVAQGIEHWGDVHQHLQLGVHPTRVAKVLHPYFGIRVALFIGMLHNARAP